MNVKGLAALTLMVALMPGITSCGSEKPAEGLHPGPVLPVETVEIRLITEPSRLELAGEARSRNRIEIASKVSGRIVELLVTEGSRVARGDLLLRLDAPELTSALAQARAMEEVAHLEWMTATRQAERYRRLATGEVVTARDLELALVAEAGARARYERARAATEMNERNLGYAELRAPRNARVVGRRVREGDLANPGQSLLVLEDDSTPEVRVTLPAHLKWPVIAGDRAEIRLISDPDRVIAAAVDRISPSADNYTFEIFLNADGLDVPTGTFVRAVLLGEPTEVIRIPDHALVKRGPLTGVFVVQEGRAVLRWLRMAPDGRVSAGLSPGEHVILNPPSLLEAGQPVEVIS